MSDIALKILGTRIFSKNIIWFYFFWLLLFHLTFIYYKLISVLLNTK